MPHRGPSCRRTRILDAACSLLRRQGPDKTTIAQVARAAKVGVGTVYLEFASKDAIITALSERRHEGVLAAMRAAACAPNRSFELRLAAIFERRTARFLELADDGTHAPSLLCANTCAAVREACSSFREAQIAVIEDFLRRAREADALRVEPDARAVAKIILLAHASFEPPQLLTRARDEIEADLSAMVRLILDGLRHRAWMTRSGPTNRGAH